MKSRISRLLQKSGPPPSSAPVRRLNGMWVKNPESGQVLCNFSSNDYLGLSGHEKVVSAAAAAVVEYGLGAASSRFASGFHPLQGVLEEELADFLGVGRVAHFSCGFMTNLGAIRTLAAMGDATGVSFFVAASSHMASRSALEGIPAPVMTYGDRDAGGLDAIIKGAPNPVVVTDGVFSATGEVAPLGDLANVAGAHDALLVVDDAHGVAVLGAEGKGTREVTGIAAESVDLLLGTCSKGLGTYGGFVGGSAELVEYIRHNAASYAFSTALPPSLLAATRESIRITRSETWRRRRLTDLVGLFRDEAAARGIVTGDSMTPIQLIHFTTGLSREMVEDRLANKGFFLRASGDRGNVSSRINLTVNHKDSEVRALLDAVDQVNGSEV